MGVLNLTPDSFSDKGQFFSVEKALKRAEEIEKEGADIIDIGGESTGPNSQNVSLEEELNRIIPVLKILRKRTKLPISIDSYKSEVAKQTLDLGADIVNDVTALRQDKKMADLIAKRGCPVILMFSKDNTPRTTVQNKKYKDIMKTLNTFFKARIAYAKKHGVKGNQIIIDPGMGQFISAIPKYSFEIIAKLKELKSFKLPILLGLSRKSFMGGEMSGRDEKGKPLSAIAYLNGASIIRTHDVKGLVEFFNKFN